jgi:hypothetical protein
MAGGAGEGEGGQAPRAPQEAGALRPPPSRSSPSIPLPLSLHSIFLFLHTHQTLQKDAGGMRGAPVLDLDA